MGRCCGVCTGEVSQEEYAGLIKGAAQILGGNTSALRRELTERMQTSAEEERFEEAARCRDIIAALDSLREKQKVVFAPGEEADVFALFDGGDCSAVSVLSVRDGVLSDKSDYPFGAEEIADAEGMSAFICGYYRARDYVPSRVLLSFPLDEEANAALTACLSARQRDSASWRWQMPPRLFGHTARKCRRTRDSSCVWPSCSDSRLILRALRHTTCQTSGASICAAA
jgi:excinuclease UvrABC nuclease subunit